MGSKRTVEREVVYKVLDGELNYQVKKWEDQYNDDDWSIGDWLIFIERYVERAKSNIGYPTQALCEIRKIAALGVKCLMHHGAPTRTEEKAVKLLLEVIE